MPFTAMTPEETERRKSEMLGLVPEDGKAIGNKTLREKLGWDQDQYLFIRDELIQKNVIALGRGKGGSVRRNLTENTAAATPANPKPVKSAGGYPGELSLYKDLMDVLRNRWVKDHSFDSFILEDTSQGGRRADGVWTRPDLTIAASRSYSIVPGRHFTVITFEVKHYSGLDVTAVYEALAHRRSATHSYVLAYVPESELEKFESHIIPEITDEAAKHGIGFIVANEPKDFDTWEIKEEASHVAPDPGRMDKFLKDQLSTDSQDTIGRWFK